MYIDRNGSPLHSFQLLIFKSTATGDLGMHGHHAVRVVVLQKRPVQGNAIIPHQTMAEPPALALAKKEMSADLILVQVGNM